jgi:hypothetical protein
MTYRIRFRNTGSLHESEPKTLDEAIFTAVTLSNWNQRVEIIDAETGEVVKPYEPYSEAGAQKLERLAAATTYNEMQEAMK